MKEFRVTTKDNPFNPFDEFEKWNAFDVQKGYNTLSYFCRLVSDSIDLTDEEIIEESNQAAKEIVRLNLTGNYVLVEKNK